MNQRLTRLVDEGILDKVAYSEHPPRYDYQLTTKGRDLWPVVTAMRQWGDKYARRLTPEAVAHKVRQGVPGNTDLLGVRGTPQRSAPPTFER
ncbi:MAG: helix-turn-helix domain-containing protein [Acidimicrobiales bacterium]